MQYDLGFGVSPRPDRMVVSKTVSRPAPRSGANGQLVLPGLGFRRLDNFFFALCPPPETAPLLGATAVHAASRHGLLGAPLGEPRYHVSLRPIATLEGVPRSLVEKADRAARQIDVPAFEIRFDRIVSLGGGYGKYALALAGCVSPEAQDLYRQLGMALRIVGFRAQAGGFMPHVTLLYDRKRIEAEAVRPVIWRVTDFVLIDSLQGYSKHDRLRRWPLRD
jgi:2'-5' RNA ligase